MDNGRTGTGGWTRRALWALAAAVVAALAGTGCMSTFLTASYDEPARPESAMARTNFRVESVDVKGSEAEKDEIAKALRDMEKRQNGDLVPLPYSVSIRRSTESIPGSDISKVLATLTLFVLPGWEGARHVYDIQTETGPARDVFSTAGRESDTTVCSWLMLPVGVLGAVMLRPNYDFRTGTLEERLAGAAFGTLTEARYRAGIEALREAAIRNLEGGRPLSPVDERLLDETPQTPTLLLARAKHPGDLAKSREALREISGTGELEDVALHAWFLPIRKEAAAKISGVSEERFAELAGQAADAPVAKVFLERVSSPKPLYSLVENAGIPENVREAALARIASERVLAHVAKSANGPVSLRLSALKRLRDAAALADVARHAGLAEVRLAAVGRIADTGVLADAVAGDPDAGVRLAALSRIGDAGQLGRIAMENADGGIRLAALARVSDPQVVESLAENDPRADVRAAAVQKLENASLLVRIARHDADASVRRAAVEKISVQDVLADIARNDADAQVRCRAVARVDNPAVILDAVLNDGDLGVHDIAMKRLSAEFPAEAATVTRNLFAKAKKAEEDGNVDFFGFYIGMPAADAWALAGHYQLEDGEWSLRSANSVVYRLYFTLKGLRRLTKQGNSFDELAQEVANRVGDLQRNNGEWVYKTIDGIVVRVLDQEKEEAMSRRSSYYDWKIWRKVGVGVTVGDSDKMVYKIGAAAPALRQKRAEELGRGQMAGETKTITLPGGAPMEMVWCEGFWMAKTEVTRRQWKSVMWGNGASFEGGDYPQGYVTWDEWHCFCELAGVEFPSTNEWQKACLAGGAQPSGAALDKMAWYDENCGGETHPVGQKMPNAWGLFDMYGNVAEGCSDWEQYRDGLYTGPVEVAYCGYGDGPTYKAGYGDRAPTADGCFSTRKFNPDNKHKFLGFRPIARVP